MFSDHPSKHLDDRVAGRPASSSPRLSDLSRSPNAFDTLRLLAAGAVLVSHAFALTGLPEPMENLPGRLKLGSLAVGVFFVIKRARRIMPALIVAVGFCVFVLGPLLTALPIRTYFHSAETFRYLGQAAFLPVTNNLPGVFTPNVMTAVNGSLWTLKFEVACYAFVALALFRPRWGLAVVVGAWLASVVTARLIPEDSTGAMYFVGRLAYLFRFFGTGMLFYLFRERMAIRIDLGLLCFALTVASAFTPLFAEVVTTAGAYALIVFAYRAPAWFKHLTSRGDISYGVYVYAFPIQQVLVPFSLRWEHPWMVNIAVSLPLTLLAGTLSWLIVEQPMLRRQTLARHAA